MKIKLDENLPARLVPALAAHGHDVDTVAEEGLIGRPDQDVRRAAGETGRFLMTQDLDFSDIRHFSPGTHPGLMLVRLRQPGAQALLDRISSLADELDGMAGCFVVVTDHKLRVKRP
jgi:predicted nuclease of predicted toxin-antitoxin system